MSAPAIKHESLAEVKTTDFTEGLAATSFQRACASRITEKERVFTFLVGLSNFTMATPEGVTSTLVKYWYLREAVGTNGADAGDDDDDDEEEEATDSSVLTAVEKS